MSPDSVERPSEYPLPEALRSHDGVLTLGSARAVVMTEAAQVFLMRILHEHAPHILKYALYDMGYRVGEQLGGALGIRAEDPEQAFRYLVETYQQAGHGHLSVVHLDLSLPEARLAGTDLFEVAVARQSGIHRTPRCVDHYSRGMFAGFLSQVLRREMVCEEVACQFRGDERCEFVALPLVALPLKP